MPSPAPSVAEVAPSAEEVTVEPFEDLGPVPDAYVAPPPPPPKKTCVPPDMGHAPARGFRAAGTTIVGGAVSSDGCRLVVWSNLGELLFFDVEQAKTLARLRPGANAVPAGFIDDERIVYCGDDEHLSVWDGRSPPKHIATLDPPNLSSCRALVVDRENGKVAVVGKQDEWGYTYPNYGYGATREGTVTVYDFEGHVVAKRPKVGAIAPTFAGGWYSAIDYNVDLQIRRFYDWRDPEAKPLETWPEGAAFPLYGKGPNTFEVYSALVLHNFAPGGRAPDMPRAHGMSIAGAFSPDASTAVVSYRPDREGTDGGVSFFDPTFTRELGHTATISATTFAWRDDGKVVVAFDGVNARFIEAPTGKPLGVITAGLPPIASYGFPDYRLSF
ncbi:MAG: hypothetical protein U0414_43380 [Polyangiaceae bacterium]